MPTSHKWKKKKLRKAGKVPGPTPRELLTKLSPFFTSASDKRNVRLGQLCKLKARIVNEILKNGSLSRDGSAMGTAPTLHPSSRLPTPSAKPKVIRRTTVRKPQTS